jgi:hypothetical protein
MPFPKPMKQKLFRRLSPIVFQELLFTKTVAEGCLAGGGGVPHDEKSYTIDLLESWV